MLWLKQDVGKAIWDGMQSIATFFAEDLEQAFVKAINAVGDWVSF